MEQRVSRHFSRYALIAGAMLAGCGNGMQNGSDASDARPTDVSADLVTQDALSQDAADSSVMDAGGDAGSVDAGSMIDAMTDGATASDVPPMIDVPLDVDRTGTQGCPSTGYRRLVPVTTVSELTAAIGAAMPGDQIRLAAGTYLGGATVPAAVVGTAVDRIVICGLPGEWPVIRGGTFVIRGAFITVTGLVFEGPNGDNNNVFMDAPHDIDFTGNEVRNGTWHAGIAVDTTYNISITRNFIHDNGLTDIDHGIYYRYQVGPNLIANNVIVNNHGRGVSMHDNEGDPIANATVVNNTIVRNGNTGILVSVNGASGNVVANNVLYDNGWISDHKQIRVLSGVGNIVANNIVWSPDASHVGIENATTTNTVMGNIESDPLFVGAADFHLRAGSPAIGLALPAYSPPRDFDDHARDSSPDTGAYEH